MNSRTITHIFVCSILFLLVSTCLHAQQYVPVDKGCKVEFKAIKHKDGNVIRGTLNSVKGKITFDPKQLSTASFNITIAASGIATGLSDKDDELKKEPYFNIAKYPLIKIVSTGVTQDKPGGIVYVLHGNLTIKGITKPVNIQFMATPFDTGYLFRGTLEVSRLAFNIGTRDDGFDDNVSVFIEVRTKKTGH